MTAETKIQPFDLATPQSLPEETQRSLDAKLPMLADNLRISLRRLIRKTTEVEILPHSLIRGSAICEQHKDPWWFYGTSKEGPKTQTTLLGCSPALVYSTVDHMLGGPGELTVPSRSPSPIEVNLGRRFLGNLFAEIASSLEKIPLPLHLQGEQALEEPLLSFLHDPLELYLEIPIQIKVQGQKVMIHLCLPRKVLGQPKAKPSSAKPEDSETMKGHMDQVPVPIVAELARCNLSVDEVAQLEPGDVVLFNQTPGRPLEVKLQERTLFRAQLGVHGGRYALEIQEVVDPPPAAAAAKALDPEPKTAAADPSEQRSVSATG
jgi:flagellar motor switch protein FliM